MLTPIQTHLIQQLPANTNSLLVVGDSKQELLQALQSRLPQCSVHVGRWDSRSKRLETNSPPSGVDAVLWLYLEQCQDPANVLLAFHQSLRTGGWLLTSLPNVQHHSVISGLLRGNAPLGGFSLHYTYSTIIKLLLDSGFIPHLGNTGYAPPPTGWLNDLSPVLAGLGLHANRTCHYLSVTDWIVRGIAMPQNPTVEPELMTISVCIADESIYAANLLSSPDPGAANHQLLAWRNATNAASAHNQALAIAEHDWVLCIHQDVYLPRGWIVMFQQRIAEAEKLFGHLSVVGVYGVANDRFGATRCGSVIDRDRLLSEGAALPHQVDSLDELLIAVRKSSGLRFEPQLGWHFYGTDICLAAHERGLRCAVVDALCFHNSQSVDVPSDFWISKQRFADKWKKRLPIETSCINCQKCHR